METRTAPVVFSVKQVRKSWYSKFVLIAKQDESSSAQRPNAISPSPGLQKQPVRNEIPILLAFSSTFN